jgi:putative ubiquitin-RnfH superfamily antitoxin RatB of RatAB toxin-antitoxin module
MADAGRQPSRLKVEVVYAFPAEQVLMELQVKEGTTVGQAIALSGIQKRFPDLRVSRGSVGIFGRPVDLDALLRDGDRVEIYRPLRTHPKQARRERARKPRKPAVG